ncbi:LysR family transcriptional regulator [Paraburkholderia sediminicola]|uniref:LysR family transcriptional regulator n=1 Tax=Paraburkholderia sediminicola TaxID=458836 RepID=UPI0038BA40D9
MNINTVDLNLFLVFRAVYVTRSVTQASDLLHMTQSAVSNALRRLRERFDDQLFVRTSSGMEPTPMADGLIGLVEDGLAKFTQAIDQAQRFEPIHSDRRFRIAVNDIGQLVLMPSLLSAAREQAPLIRFETIGASSGDEAKGLLLEGKIDVVVGNWPPMGQGFRQLKLCDETFVGLLRRDHEIQSDKLSIEEYLNAEHLAYRPSSANDAALQETLFSCGALAQRKVVLAAAHSLGLEHVVSTSGLLLSVPSRLAQVMMQSRPDLRLVHLPFQVGPFQVWLQWHERFNSDSGNCWLRQLIKSVFQSLPPMISQPD